MPFKKKIFYLLVLCVVVASYIWLPTYLENNNIWFLCFFRSLYDIKCPACGTTTATLLLLKGDIAGAFFVNPLSIITNLLISISTVWIAIDVIRNKETFIPVLQKEMNKYLILFVILIVGVNWLYVLFQ